MRQILYETLSRKGSGKVENIDGAIKQKQKTFQEFAHWMVDF
jgi:hypothetical protein